MYLDIFWVWDCASDVLQHTVTFSKSASEEVGDRGLMGLREGELPTLETHSGSGTYRTCKHNPCLYLHRHCLCANTHCTPHMHTQGAIKHNLSRTHMHAAHIQRNREWINQHVRISRDGSWFSWSEVWVQRQRRGWLAVDNWFLANCISLLSCLKLDKNIDLTEHGAFQIH